MLSKIRSHKGFTLIELMIVVAIIGILAAIAIPNFLRFQLKAKTSEAKSTIGNIKMLETTFKAEYSYYIGNALATSDAYDPGGAKVAFKAAGIAACDGWYEIGFEQTGMVYYQYDVFAGVTNPPAAVEIGQCNASAGATGPPIPSTNLGTEMAVAAVADLDGTAPTGKFLYCSDPLNLGLGTTTIAGVACNKAGEVVDMALGEF